MWVIARVEFVVRGLSFVVEYFFALIVELLYVYAFGDVGQGVSQMVRGIV